MMNSVLSHQPQLSVVDASEGALSKGKPPPRCSERVQKRVQKQAQQDQKQACKGKPKTPPRRSRIITGEDARPEFVKLASHILNMQDVAQVCVGKT